MSLSSPDDAGRGWTVSVIIYSVGPEAIRLRPTGPTWPRIRGWQILSEVAAASVVHVSRPHTRAGENAVLAARSLGKPLVVSEIGTETSALGRSFGLLDLADIIIHAREEASDRVNQAVEIIDLGVGGWLAQLQDVYGRLLPSAEV